MLLLSNLSSGGCMTSQRAAKLCFTRAAAMTGDIICDSRMLSLLVVEELVWPWRPLMEDVTIGCGLWMEFCFTEPK